MAEVDLKTRGYALLPPTSSTHYPTSTWMTNLPNVSRTLNPVVPDCHRGDSCRSSPLNLVNTLVYQAADALPALGGLLAAQDPAHLGECVHSWHSALQGLLKEPLTQLLEQEVAQGIPAGRSGAPSVVLLVDGLDEAGGSTPWENKVTGLAGGRERAGGGAGGEGAGGRDGWEGGCRVGSKKVRITKQPHSLRN